MSKRLLLADDSITIQKVIQITFAHEDYELTITDNGDSAFARAKDLLPDLVLADVYMPGKNGYELCAAIKQDPALQHIPVLLLAGSFEPFDEGKARSAGAESWIEKPFESQALIDRVATLLNATSQPAPVSAVPPVFAPVAPVVAVEPVAPEAVDPFADITFEEPAAAAVSAATADDWRELNELPVVPAEVPMAPADFAFEEAPPPFEFAAEPFSPAEAPLAFMEPAAGAGADEFGEVDEVMALGDDDILGAEDLEPAGEMPTLSPWSREVLAAEEPFETFAAAEPFAPAVAEAVPAVFEPIPVAPSPAMAPPLAPAPAETPVAAPAVVVEQRVATLTEAEIEQIVERAVGRAIEKLAGSVLERVAWEVVPDLAEALIKDEIRKIKDTAA